ncbi:type II secretion system F family protein [Micrococcus luteus]|uniref:type II secretion system F family protein n=1 Tax=Micrococcus luteus TaxID=1270 RepID=UPI00254A0F57|nr:type II secretion system F family protein [Micrococcus luteus]MDK8526242.1 type II secretion system F family protein [Micrococcus luteus]MDK8729761.1 type II secretion system F family protein [Micrococcus luteus]
MAFGSGGGSAQIEKLAQMEMWTRSLSGLIVAGTSLETALAASMPNAGDLIRDEIATMNARIKAGWPTADALKRLGLEWGDQTGDLVVMQLILAANQRGQGLANSLDDLSTSVEEEVSKRRAIYADRAGARREARIVITIVVISLCLVPGMGGPMAAYQTPLGQALYLVLALVTAGLIIWMTRVVAPPPQVRLLTARSSS